MKKSSLLFLSLVPLLTQAQSELEEIEVASTEQLTAPTSAERTEKLNQIPGGVSGVESKKFESSKATNIKDMLDFSPGVYSQVRYGDEARLSIRGAGLSRTFHLRGIRLLQDGVQINGSDGGGDFQEIDPMSYEFVEVYRGANAFPYGVSTLGGAVNFVTKNGRHNPGARVRLEGGSFGNLREVLSYGGAKDNVDYYLTTSHLNAEGYRDHSVQSNTRINSNIGIKHSSKLEQRFYIMWQDIDQELPGSLTKKTALENPTAANAAAVSGDQQRDLDVKRFIHKVSWRPSKIDVNGGWYVTRKKLYHPIFQLIDVRSWDYGVFGDASSDVSLFDTNHRWKFGALLNQGNNDSRRFVNNRGDRGALTSDAIERSKNAEFTLDDVITLNDKVSLSAGVLFTVAERDYEDQFESDGDRSGKKTYRGAPPRVGLLWERKAHEQYFMNVSNSFEPPTFSELTQSLPGVSGLVNLAPQRATTLEVGTRNKGDSFAYEVSLYRSWIKDELMTYAVNGSGTSGVINADETIHQGLETGAQKLLWSGENGKSLTLNAQYTLGDFYFNHDKQWGSNPLPGAPRHYVRGELAYKYKKFTLAPQVEWVPEAYPVDMANTMWANPYVLFGLKSKYDYSHSGFVFMDIRNLTDKRYIATTGVITRPTTSNTAQFTPGDGFGVFVGGEHRW